MTLTSYICVYTTRAKVEQNIPGSKPEKPSEHGENDLRRSEKKDVRE